MRCGGWIAIFATLLLAAFGALVVQKSGPAFRHPLVAYHLLRSARPARLPVPVTGVKPRQLRDSWGAPRSGGRTHKGIDIFAPRGRAIVSTTDGIVVTVGTNQLGGRIVRVSVPRATGTTTRTSSVSARFARARSFAPER